MGDRLLTTKDVAEQLGVTVNRVQAMIRAERLPAQRLGRDYVIKESDLALVAERKAGRPKKENDAGPSVAPAVEAVTEVATVAKPAAVKAVASWRMGRLARKQRQSK